MNESNLFELSRRGLLQDELTEFIKQGARALIQQALEAEVTDLVESLSHRKMPTGTRAVVRNGFLPEREIQTGIGPVTVKVPKVRAKDGTPISFQSALVPPYVRKTKSLEASIPWLYLKGISTGEMADALSMLVGPDAKGLSPSTVSRLKESWREEYKEWCKRDLSVDEWVYLWADGIYSGVRGAENSKLCALVVMGVNERGEKHFLAIEDGTRESAQSWKEVLIDLEARGVKNPKLAIGDGALGFWSALDEVFPDTRQQRCWVHKTGNVLNKLPKGLQLKAKKLLHDIWQADDKKAAIKAFNKFIATYEDKHPRATECLEKDREELLTFYDFPAKHWMSIRTTNPIESTFGTIRHRSRATKNCVSREGILYMIFKLGQCAQKRWRKLRGFDYLGKVITGVKFKDGIEVKESNEGAA